MRPRCPVHDEQMQVVEIVLLDEEVDDSAQDHLEAGLGVQAAQQIGQAGSRVFVTLHVLVPGSWTVQVGHDWSERIEADIRLALPHAHVTTHLEPIEDPLSMIDKDLDRPAG